MDLLRQVGVSVDTWLKSAMNQVMEELENERWATLPTLTTHDLSISVSTLFIKNQSPYEVVRHSDFLTCVISSN